MKQRCTNPNKDGAEWYFGTICADKWATFEGFWSDMQFGYSDDLTLERIDSQKGYNKENCRWATTKEQSRNRRSNVFIEYKGNKICVSDFAAMFGLRRSMVYSRVKAGVPVEELAKPSRKHNLKESV
jgi:hypothetical protein